MQHNDGESSDDELSSLDQATLSKTRQDVESQARQTLSDVVEDFATISGVKVTLTLKSISYFCIIVVIAFNQERMEAWKSEDPDSYTDAYVSLCLPKVFSPLVRLQLLFWNPLASDASQLEQMEWHKALLTFHLSSGETEASLSKDPDRRLVSVVVEKVEQKTLSFPQQFCTKYCFFLQVVLPKMTGLVKCAYDPLSTTQTLTLTRLAKRLFAEYPTLRGDSKQVREFLTAAKDRIKLVIDSDPYIPIGYAKQ